MWLVVLWIVVLIAAAYLHLRHLYSFFSRRGVKTQGVIPPFGHMGKMLIRKEHFIETIDKAYNAFPNERFVGRYEFVNPVLVVKDLELIKKIAVKDFEYFLDHRTIVDKDNDPLFGRNLFAMKGQEWKDMRSTLSPAFTSSKLKLMLPFMVDVGDQMVKNLQKTYKEHGAEFMDVDVKDVTTRFANDVIASCAFGLKVDSHTEKENTFYSQALIASTFKFKQLIMFLLFATCPWIMAKLKIKLFGEETSTFFRSIVLDTMKDREKRNIVRPDMIHLLMEAQKGTLTHEATARDEDAGFATVEESAVGKKAIDRVWTDDDLVAQAVLFFIAGFETASSGMTFLLFELALNPDVQDKLAKEIRETEDKTGGKVDFNAIQEMTYLDMVVSELLRKWPAGVALDRMCEKEYNLGKPNDKADEDYIVRKGDGIQIPVWSIHRDPEYFPDPEKFDPERFSEENKHEIKPFTYMPFGLGPRNCIGSRFALTKMKILAYHLIRDMEFSPSAKSQLPIELDPISFNLRIKGGHWLRFKLRNSEKC